jgi:hypothetical protein
MLVNVCWTIFNIVLLCVIAGILVSAVKIKK